jgi:hypothetical protein
MGNLQAILQLTGMFRTCCGSYCVRQPPVHKFRWGPQLSLQHQQCSTVDSWATLRQAMTMKRISRPQTLWSGAVSRANSEPKVCMNLSTSPSLCGCKGVVCIFMIPSRSHIPANTLESKFMPWSEWSTDGTSLVPSPQPQMLPLGQVWSTLPATSWCSRWLLAQTGFVCRSMVMAQNIN